jgi:hypothetical protein
MTDLIERVNAAFIAETEPTLENSEGRPREAGRHEGDGSGTNRPLPILLAITTGSSAVLWFAMSSGHLHGVRATAGIVAALAEVTFAVAVLARPSRTLYAVAGAANIVIGALWLGVEGADGVSAATAAIGLTLSVVAVLVSIVLARKPVAGSGWSSGTSVIGSVVPVAVVALTIAALFGTSSSGAGSGARASSATSAAGGSAAAQALSSTVKVPGENSKTFQSIVAGNETEQSELKKWVPLDAQDQAILSNQLYQALQAAERYPTVAAAKADHMILAGGMAPGVGAHYQVVNGDILKGINPDGTVNPLYPASWIYASTADNAPVVGVMYEAFGQSPPAGFIGPNDHWHRHSDVCVQYGVGKISVPFAADQDVTPQECADVHGQFMKKTIWMVHAWVVPGWESPQGVFSHDNLHVYCPGNTDITNAIGFCVRQQ